MKIGGREVMSFLSGIRHAIDEAGGGQFREFKLLMELDKIGLAIIAVEYPLEERPTAPATPAATDEAT